MKTLTLLLAAGALVFAGCGDDAEPAAGGSGSSTTESAVAKDAAAMEKDGAPAEKDEGEATTGGGVTITTGDSQFGEMLYNAEEQAIYVFEIDRPDESVCYGKCAEGWPPVLTEGEPQADGNADGSLLGTIERNDGTTQVTYDRQPLYYYAHEGPGLVLCHDVFRDGGEWWVVGPDGQHL